jgi:hypothetical protein
VWESLLDLKLAHASGNQWEKLWAVLSGAGLDQVLVRASELMMAGMSDNELDGASAGLSGDVWALVCVYGDYGAHGGCDEHGGCGGCGGCGVYDGGAVNPSVIRHQHSHPCLNVPVSRLQVGTLRPLIELVGLWHWLGPLVCFAIQFPRSLPAFSVPQRPAWHQFSRIQNRFLEQAQALH